MSCWCASESPSSQGPPACLMDVSGEAPVPPSWPEIWMMSASAFATPEATVPMPTCRDREDAWVIEGAMDGAGAVLF